MSIQDTKERIFVNGQIYSRPIGGGPVHGPDNRRFTPDPNPYDVAPEPRGYGQGNVGFADTTPDPYKLPQHNFDPVTPEERERTRILEGRKPFPNTEGLDPFSPNPFKNLPLDYLNQYLNDRGVTEQNQEVMGSKEQVFPRYANPADGTLTFGAPQGPAKVLVDGPPPRRRPTLFDLNVDWENTSLEELRGLQKMLEDIYTEPDDFILNQAEPTGMRMAALDPTDDLLLRSLLKGEIGPTTDPNIRKAIQKLEERKYRGGRADSMEGALMAADPSFVIGGAGPREVSSQEVKEINRRVISDYDKKKEMLRRGLLAPLLRGV